MEVNYSLDPAVAALCTENCPILEAFNGNDPEASTQAYIHKVVIGLHLETYFLISIKQIDHIFRSEPWKRKQKPNIYG